MDLETVKEVMTAIQGLGEGARSAFLWWLLASTSVSLAKIGAITGVVLFFGRRITAAAVTALLRAQE